MNLSKENIYDYCAFLLLFSLGFSKAIPSIILVLLIPFAIAKLYKNKICIPNKSSYIIFCILVLYFFLKSLLYNSINIEFKILSYSFFVVAMPLVFLSVDKYKIVFGFIAGVFMAVLISTIKIIKYYIEFQTIPLSDGNSVYEVLSIHRPYFGFACLVSAILCFYTSRDFPKYKKQLIFLALFFVFFIFFISARLSAITTIILAVIYLFFYSKISLQKKFFFLLLGTIIIFVGITKYSNLSNRFFVKQNFETIKDYEPRFVIWDCSLKIMSSDNFNIVFGSNTRELMQSQLRNCYASSIKKESKREWYLKTDFNTHNQFIDFFLSGGIVGLVLFAAFVISLIYISRKNFYMLFITLSLILFLCFENLLHRQYGGYLIGIILILMMKFTSNNQEE